MNLLIDKWRSGEFKLTISVFILVLFHISAIIGISIGYQDWFVEKTPFTLLLSFLLLIWNFPIETGKKWLLAGVFFFSGMLAEWIGVNTGWLFGNYAYGENMGPKFDGVPYLIGIYWAVLTFISGRISSRISANLLLRILSGAALMVLLDFAMEVSAPVFDFWTFEGGVAPIENYITWFIVAALLHLLYQKADLQGDFKFSISLYLVLFFFFSYFFVYYSI
ncbi:carotenoid biosynthesis protein [Salegentibacter sp. Hel_I_6]|uniref:carotenoid biosynthesis protein n=1 Tax=Salegentibacter sp. Hel_I_6 TaxID=1250278 RepID=UPI00068CB10D|nr:carotenoid biosynthesis protein [Salegentibacter sp. Hel_I_6]